MRSCQCGTEVNILAEEKRKVIRISIVLALWAEHDESFAQGCMFAVSQRIRFAGRAGHQAYAIGAGVSGELRIERLVWNA